MEKRNLWDMQSLDIFLNSMSHAEYKKYIKLVTPTAYLSPTPSWGLADWVNDTHGRNADLKDLEVLNKLAIQLNWSADIKNILKNNYDALVLTDVSQNIVWTNPGFQKMTGYNTEYAVGKTPRFLQGDETRTDTKFSIGKKLLRDKPFKEKVLNYKKSKQQYWCELHIFPLLAKNKTTHYLALEKEIV